MCRCCSRSCGKPAHDEAADLCFLAGSFISRRRAGFASSCALRLPADRGSRAGGQGAGADGNAALPQVPEPVYRGQRCADGRRHAPSGADPHCCRRGSCGGARMVGTALWRLRELQADREHHDLALVRDSPRAVGAGGTRAAPPPGSVAMTWVLAIVLALAAFALSGVAFRVPRPGWSTFGAALALGLAGYALQANPEVPGAPAVGLRATGEADWAFVDARKEMVASADRSTSDRMIVADALARQGQYANAA